MTMWCGSGRGRITTLRSRASHAWPYHLPLGKRRLRARQFLLHWTASEAALPGSVSVLRRPSTTRQAEERHSRPRLA